MAVGRLGALLSQLLFMMPWAVRSGYRYRFNIDLTDPHARQIALMAAPVVLGVSVNQLNVVIDKTLASGLAVGGISVLAYANRITELVHGVLVLSVMAVLYPSISKLVVGRDLEKVKELTSNALTGLTILLVPVTVGTLLLSDQLVAALYARGAFDARAETLTSTVLLYYAIGLVAIGYREILVRLFYSMQDSVTPMVSAVLGAVINILLNIILSKYMGLAGLALATSISAIITSTLLYWNLRKRVGPILTKKYIFTLGKVMLASAIMAASLTATSSPIAMLVSPVLSLLITIAIGAGIYFLVLYYLKIDELNAMFMSFIERTKM